MRAIVGRVFERLVAGIVIIGALLWGASLLATPEAPAPIDDAAARSPESDAPVQPPAPPAPAPAEEQPDEDDADERDDRKGKGKRGPD